MQKRPKLGWYYLFFILLLAAAAGAVVLTLSKASDAKIDNATKAKVIESSDKLESFVSKNGQIPVSLDDAGVNNVPSTITYTKLNDSQYKICASYKANGTGIGGASLTGAVLGFRNGSGAAPQNNSFLDVYTMAYAYKKGMTCQTITPDGLSSSSNDSSAPGDATNSSDLIAAKCGSSGNVFELKDETTIQSVDSGQGVITLSTTGAKLTDKNSKPISSLGAIKYDSLTTAYATAGCQKLTSKEIDSLKPGAGITVYLYSHDSTYADQIEL